MSAESDARKIAETLKISDGKSLQQDVIQQVQQNLATPPKIFDPTVSTIGSLAEASLGELLAAPAELPTAPEKSTLKTPEFTQPVFDKIAASDLATPDIVTPKVIEPFTPSPLEQQARDADTKRFIQQVRDASAARGINQSQAGVFIEGQLLIQRNLKLAEQDFQRTRQLVLEELRRSQFEGDQLQRQFQNQFTLDQQSTDAIEANNISKQKVFNNQMAVFSLEMTANDQVFTQEFANKAFQEGREDKLDAQKLNVIGLGLQRAGIDFNEQQIEFVVNLQAKGIPIQQGVQLMGLIQKGDISAANLVMEGLGIDAETQDALVGAFGSVAGGITSAVTGFGLTKLFS